METINYDSSLLLGDYSLTIAQRVTKFLLLKIPDLPGDDLCSRILRTTTAFSGLELKARDTFRSLSGSNTQLLYDLGP